MKISLEQNRKRLLENKRKLNEGTSNFWSMDRFPLLVFDDYETISDQIVDELKNEHEEFKDMEYWEIQETPEYEEAWDKVKVCVLDESEVDELENDIKEFNRNINYDDRYDDYEDTEVKVEVKPGYYQAAQIYVNDENYLQDWQIEEINKFLKELKEKYHLTTLSVAYRFSNGETGYDIVKEAYDDEVDKTGWHKSGIKGVFNRDTTIAGFISKNMERLKSMFEDDSVSMDDMISVFQEWYDETSPRMSDKEKQATKKYLLDLPRRNKNKFEVFTSIMNVYLAGGGLGMGSGRKVYREATKKVNPALKYREDVEQEEPTSEEETDDSQEDGHFEEVDEELWEEFKKFKKI